MTRHGGPTPIVGSLVTPVQKRSEGASFSAVAIVVHKPERQGEAARQRSCENRMDSDICIVEPE